MEREESTTPLQRLLKVPVREKSLWNVFAYAVNKDIIDNNDLYGVVVCLGGFPTYEKASAHASKIVATTDYRGVVVSRYAYPYRLTKNMDPSTVQPIVIDAETGKVIKTMFDTPPPVAPKPELTGVTDLQYSWYRAIKWRSQIEALKVQLASAECAFDKNMAAIRNRLASYPEDGGDGWLVDLKEKLTARGEELLYTELVKGYDVLSKEL
jgi:hypothetical protein